VWANVDVDGLLSRREKVGACGGLFSGMLVIGNIGPRGWVGLDRARGKDGVAVAMFGKGGLLRVDLRIMSCQRTYKV
jgi:hypothetical protein